MDAITALLTSLLNWFVTGWAWLLSEKGKDTSSTLSNLAGILTFLAGFTTWLFFRKRNDKRQPIPLDPKANADILKRNRQRMLEKVRHMWVEGVLEQSLYRVARLELGYKESPEMVEHSWNLVVEQPGRQSEPIRAGTPMIELFDRFDKTLLILGAPGAGKTTLLLELARDLIKRAEKELEHPIPVIFNLSSWALQHPPIADWLIDELRKRYDVPEKIARFWIENEAILPLLDGLDEVAKEHRNTCVEAINAYRENNGLLPIAICSRIADYEALASKLHLQHAVTVQSLTPEQVDRYLAEAGEPLEPVRKLVKEDATLMELLDNPLMLSIMPLAFWNNADAATTLENGSNKKRRGKLFYNYIAAMFKRRETSAPYKPEQTKQWLSRLAESMTQREQTVFYIEQLQPDILSHNIQTIYFYLYFTIGALFGGFSGGWLGFGGLIGFSLTLLVIGSGDLLRNSIKFSEKKFSPREWLQWIKTLSIENIMQGIMYLVLLSITTLIVKNTNQTPFTPTDFLKFMPLFIMSFNVGALTVGSLLNNKFTYYVLSERSLPNEEVYHSLKNSLFFGLSLGFVIAFFSSLISDFSTGLKLGLSFGLLINLSLGGYAVIQHYVLRFLLWREGFAPLRYVRFLDHAADLLFLRKVGGGYIFAHRLIMEHFAAMEDAETTS